MRDHVMNTKSNLSRITIDIPSESHKRLKALAAVLGKSMREIVLESIEKYVHTTNSPNKETLKAIKNVEMGKDLASAENAKDLFKKLGI